MINACIDIRYLNEAPSGVGNYIKNLVSSLIRHHSDSISFYLLGNKNNFKCLDPSLNFKKIASPSSPTKHPAHDIWYNTSFLKLLKKNKIDIFHATAFMVPFRKLPCKLVTTIHDRVAKRMPHTLPLLFRYLLNINVKYAVKLSDSIIAVSNFTKCELYEEFKSLPLIFPIHNGCIERKGNKKPETKSRQKPYILYIGNIEPRKGIMELIKAYEDFRDKNGNQKEDLILCGSVPWNYNEPKNYLKNSKYRDSIIFKGYVSDSELGDLYENSSLNVIPSLYEGFGLPALEAMKFSSPILINDIPVLNEVCGGIVGKTDVTDTSAFSNEILKQLSLAETSQNRLLKYQEHLKNFTWEECARKTKEVYEKMVL